MRNKIKQLQHAYNADANGTWSFYLAGRIASEVAAEMAIKGFSDLHARGMAFGVAVSPLEVIGYLASCIAATRPVADTLTPPQIAKLCRVRIDTVLGWIRSGKLKAINTGKRIRPRYKVTIADLDRFRNQNAVTPPPKRTRQVKDPDVIEFF